ncbi:uncharacterized protein LOC104438752 [Eucalyptus grandis]|uniref:Uncharacterized protein n=2 Tax=Eucalyptus grandis TaxID=71139 RepID=A0ACC3LB28_EUCGR|nr:uncharacterized protein LOC104438752 [Eucalyptus grandis]KAK3435469.1 hypothetical protein EUGRSUZ_C00167 [Eucalyptus grandis]
MDNWPLLGRLRRAVHKVRFLLNFDLHRWISNSATGRGPSSKRLLSFSNPSGLRACASMDDKEYQDSPGSSRGSGLQRTISYPSEDDVDSRAEMFITNFHRQLQLERQISMDLHYCRGNSFGSRSP